MEDQPNWVFFHLTQVAHPSELYVSSRLQLGFKVRFFFFPVDRAELGNKWFWSRQLTQEAEYHSQIGGLNIASVVSA